MHKDILSTTKKELGERIPLFTTTLDFKPSSKNNILYFTAARRNRHYFVHQNNIGFVVDRYDHSPFKYNGWCDPINIGSFPDIYQALEAANKHEWENYSV